jgi:cyclopropane-fatty-acyl-phospholipid synthase
VPDALRPAAAPDAAPRGPSGAAATPASPDSGVHYDVPPGVFELLLDRNMNYSSGYYPRGDEDLDAAQVAKMERIAGALRLGSGDRLRRGLEDAVRVDVRSVMDLPYADASFDRVTFLESIIHMPEKDALFRRCHELLSPGGRLLIQESCYDRESMRGTYLEHRGFDEVNRAFGYSSHLVSGGEMIRRLEEAGFLPLQLENISGHYVRTLSQWLQNLDARYEAMQAISPRAARMLRRYLMIALGTYRSGHTLCHLITAGKAG